MKKEKALKLLYVILMLSALLGMALTCIIYSVRRQQSFLMLIWFLIGFSFFPAEGHFPSHLVITNSIFILFEAIFFLFFFLFLFEKKKAGTITGLNGVVFFVFAIPTIIMSGFWIILNIVRLADGLIDGLFGLLSSGLIFSIILFASITLISKAVKPKQSIPPKS